MKDLNVLEFEEVVDTDTPLGLLRGIKYGTETYHTLFMRLCRSVFRFVPKLTLRESGVGICGGPTGRPGFRFF